ncbi:para-aminobenzoate N-oxygenase AurF [Streptomyces sp. 1114.5]|uniref:AurF N-oxygenase family protein n=1 Tax=Streptomyces sp. 1114.5 TaxID=1938830 RepID=UPI000EB33EAE|nr:diiron oxygenase [Streptomyces sp. 1114.5]RKT19036.1 para-aminobenzoate N-oxygenase AurF [Streptomyces sp. 1114.5]
MAHPPSPHPSPAPQLPEHDPDDPVENAVIARLAGNWARRASVKRAEPDLDDLFEPDRPDYPEHLLPFHDHPAYLALDGGQRARLLAWAWVAFNKNVMDNEQRVVNPGFELIARDAFGTGLSETSVLAATQAMVDEQYHTLMHLNASAVTRRRRGWQLPESALPVARKARRHAERLAEAGQPWQRELTTLAFATVSELSINAYLNLIAEDPEVQPVNRATATMHNRDEYCHSAISKEVAKEVCAGLDAERRAYFLDAVGDGMRAFGANDFTTWRRVVRLVGVADGERMMRDVEQDQGRTMLVQDYSALYALCTELGALEEIDFDWGGVTLR